MSTSLYWTPAPRDVPPTTDLHYRHCPRSRDPLADCTCVYIEQELRDEWVDDGASESWEGSA